LQAIIPPTIRKVDMFNPANGAYQYSCYGVGVYDAFKQLVSCMSDNLIDFDSNYFAFDFSADGNFLLVSTGLSIINATTDPAIVSFESLYTALNKKLRLGMVIEIQSNGRPLIRIEPATYFNQQGAVVNLYDQPKIELKFDSASQYASIDFGSKPYLEQHECNNGDTACTFFQDSFRGFKVETFGMIGECNISNVLKLNSEDIVFDTNVIEDTYVHSNQNYNNNTFVIQSFWNLSLDKGFARQFDPYQIGQTVYNGEFTNQSVSNNWVGGIPNSIYSYLDVFNPNSTEVIAYANASPLQEFFITSSLPPQYISYFIPGIRDYLAFGNEILDPNNNFDGVNYSVPYTATYTFYVNVTVSNTDEAYIQIVRRTSTGVIIDYSDSAIGIAFDGITNLNKTWITVCNEGDIINVNLYAKRLFTSGIAIIENTYDIYTTQFNAIGEPFPNSLLVVDPNSIKRYVYSFDRPLRMEEIEAILDNTSRPIKFGQFDDPLRVIEGYINKVDIKSIIKQDASITLKSNKILR
jgi:hypothetical protein